MIFSNAFKEVDNHLRNNLHTIKCNDIFEIKNDFYKMVKSLCGSTANLTGITELLVFRLMYHVLNMDTPVENKLVKKENICLHIGNRYIGKNGRYQEPDITIAENEVIKYLFSIKNQLSNVSPNKNEKTSPLVKELLLQNGVYTTAIQDIYRIENIRHHTHSNFCSLTVVYSKVTQGHEKTIRLIQETFDWHTYLILENNSNLFIKELSNKLNLNM